MSTCIYEIHLDCAHFVEKAHYQITSQQLNDSILAQTSPYEDLIPLLNITYEIQRARYKLFAVCSRFASPKTSCKLYFRLTFFLNDSRHRILFGEGKQKNLWHEKLNWNKKIEMIYSQQSHWEIDCGEFNSMAFQRHSIS